MSISVETTQTLDTMLHQILNQALVAVNAKSGSLMLVDSREHILQIKARLGEPRSGRTSERVFEIGDKDDSIAGWVVRHQRSRLCVDVDSDRAFASSRSGKNFRSLLSVPIIYEDRVLAVINADATDPDHFGEEHRELLERVAAQVAAPINDRISIIDAVKEVGVELTRLPREGGVERTLQKIADLAVRSLGADAVTVYQYIRDRDEFPVEGTGPTISGAIGDKLPMQRRVHPGDVPWTMVKERRSGFFANVREVDFLTRDIRRPGERPRPRFVAREAIRSAAALLLPFRAKDRPDEEVVGVMFANYRSPHSFNIDERAALATFADYAAVAILNARREEQRMVEQIQIIGSISHNFAHRMSNLAGPARLTAELLREKIPVEDRSAHEQLDELARDADLLMGLAKKLVHRFRETARPIEIVSIDVAELLRQELSGLRLDPVRLRLESHIPDDLPHVRSDEFQLRWVVRDVMMNALEAMAGNRAGLLTVNVKVNTSRPRVEVEISDTGSGVPDDIRDRLFTPGVSSKKDKLGIGLAYSRSFLQAAGGNLALKETLPGRGSTFLLEIPCVDLGDSRTSAAAPARDILIVDDLLRWQHSVRGALESSGRSIDVASSYREAYDAMARAHYRLAIVDVRLVEGDRANRDGWRLVADMDKFDLKTRVIVITGHPDEYDLELQKRHDNRMLGVLRKGDLRLTQLRELVQRALAEDVHPPDRGDR